MVCAALLMVSEVPTYSFKKFKLAPKFVLPFMVLIGLLIAGLASAPWEVLSLVGLAYLATIPLSLASYRRLKSEAERLQADAPVNQTDSASDQNGAAIHPLRKS